MNRFLRGETTPRVTPRRVAAAAAGLAALLLAAQLLPGAAPAHAAEPAGGEAAGAAKDDLLRAESGKPARTATARVSRAAVSCLMSPDRVADIGSPVIGVVAAMNVDTGDTVRAGQLLLSLRDDVENAGVRTAETRARIDADERAAAAQYELASQRLERALQLEQQGFVSSQSSEQSRTEREVARQKLEQARGQKKIAQQELAQVRAQLGQRAVKAPFAGVVVDRYVNVAERVEDKPMLRIAKLDPLRIELVVPASRWGSLAPKDRVSVLPELPNAAPVSATVTRIDQVIDGASNTFRVRLALPNPGNKLPAGARCRVQFPGDGAGENAAGRSGPPAALTARAKPAG